MRILATPRALARSGQQPCDGLRRRTHGLAKLDSTVGRSALSSSHYRTINSPGLGMGGFYGA